MTTFEFQLAAQLVAFLVTLGFFLLNLWKVRQLRRVSADIDKRVVDADKHFDARRKAFIEERTDLMMKIAADVAAEISARTGERVEIDVEEVDFISNPRDRKTH